MVKDEYNKLLKSGMFWEMYPNLTGDWEEDKYSYEVTGSHLAYLLENNIEVINEAIRLPTTLELAEARVAELRAEDKDPIPAVIHATYIVAKDVHIPRCVRNGTVKPIDDVINT